ncbi:hypothetical protein ACFQY7_49775 [Actinomadura luteofluorescens]|uniref:hypothetical protein n=1 Tax=Actinomadura luteofluorescens TaxID=46163 RepID=UPI003378E53D
MPPGHGAPPNYAVPPATPPGSPFGAPASAPHAAAPGVGHQPASAPGAPPAPAPHGFPEAGGAFQPEPAAGWAQTGDQSGAAGTAQSGWFFDEHTEDDVLPDEPEPMEAGGAARRSLAGRLPRPGTFDLMPTLVTFFITCLGVLLVIASLMWRPDLP